MFYSQVKSDFKTSSDALEAVRPQTNSLLEIGKRTSTEVAQLDRDIEALLNKMKELKDKISRFEIYFNRVLKRITFNHLYRYAIQTGSALAKHHVNKRNY